MFSSGLAAKIRLVRFSGGWSDPHILALLVALSKLDRVASRRRTPPVGCLRRRLPDRDGMFYCGECDLPPERYSTRHDFLN